MHITVIGSGYVGLVTGACFADAGVRVTCVDIDREKVDALNKGIIPIYEPGLEEMVKRNMQVGRLIFTTQLADAMALSDILFIAVGTPPDEDGSADLNHVLAVARSIGENIERESLIIVKSTVPVGTSELVRKEIANQLLVRGVQIPFAMASNPEFLKEGAAIKDFLLPERVIVGVESIQSQAIFQRLYKPFMVNNRTIHFMDIPSAEMTKYAANAMLATRISFMNDIANLCDIVGANIDMVRRGIGSDPRIGGRFLYAGCGYGGSCFPKDVKALALTGRKMGYPLEIIEAVDRVNERQKGVLFNKLIEIFENKESLTNLTVTVWGLSFKPETDDMRDAPSLTLIGQLLECGCKVNVYDPVAMSECSKIIGDSVNYFDSKYDAIENADALIIVTEWKEFRIPDWEHIRSTMRGAAVIDGRNIYNKQELQSLGFIYRGIGVNSNN